MTTNAFAAGWYRDPDDPNQFRWFNGTEFTDERKAAGPGLQAPTAAEVHADETAWHHFPERLDRSYPQWDSGAIAIDDAREWKRMRRNKMLGIALGLLAVATGGVVILILIPIALVVGLVLFAIGRGEPRTTREALGRWGTELGFSDEGGMLIFKDKSPARPLETIDEALLALRAGGLRITDNHRARLRGVPWRAGRGTMVQAVKVFPEYRRDPGILTIVTVPLLPEVAERFAGLAVERPRNGRKPRLRAWGTQWAHAPEWTNGQLLVTAHPDQRAGAGYDRAIAEMSHDWAWGLEGWVVADGQLTVWYTGCLLSGIGREQLRMEACKPAERAASDETRLALLLDQARNLQYLLYEPHAESR